jgi:hypothetical protein
MSVTGFTPCVPKALNFPVAAEVSMAMRVCALAIGGLNQPKRSSMPVKGMVRAWCARPALFMRRGR